MSEEIFFGYENVTTGAQDDLQKITKIAFEAVANYGMNNVVGPVSYGGANATQESLVKPFSEKTAEMLDEQVRKMIVFVLHFLLNRRSADALCSHSHQRTTELLTKHKEDVEKVAQLLLEKEVINRCVSTAIPSLTSADIWDIVRI